MAVLCYAFLVTLFVLQASTTQAAFTGAQQTEILNAHNDARSRVIPAASNMERMVWDAELAQITQNFADQCTWGHNPARSDNYPGYVGENLYIATTRLPSYTAAVTAWDDEKMYYSYDDITCTSGNVCVHYTQVVWARSSKLGCGEAFCSTVTGLPLRDATIVVCNYAPEGNDHGVKPYAQGTSCSNCPSAKPLCLSNLCSSTSEIMDYGHEGEFAHAEFQRNV